MTKSERIRKAAMGPAPRCNWVASWIGTDVLTVFEYKRLSVDPTFWRMDEPTKRTLLLLVAEALESA